MTTGAVPIPTEDRLHVLDWRRRVRDLYEAVRRHPDPALAHATWCQGRDELFGTHPASPLTPAERESFRGLPVPPYDPRFRFAVTPGPAEPERLEVVTGTDGVVVFERIGTVALGDLGRLDLWWLAQYGGGLFLPVRDALAGRDGGTFGGGRYVLDTVKGADLGAGSGGELVVDLNFSYNPSCAYDPAWACPLAPPGNRLDAEVPVGELVTTTGS